LLRPTADDLVDGLSLFQAYPALGAFDAVLVAAAVARSPEAFVSADSAFDGIPGLPYHHPSAQELGRVLGE
jgi:protein-L-isoaspartate O-methyltransferase